MVIVAIESHQGALHMQISTIGLDIAKNVFQVGQEFELFGRAS